jgi:hypothetical protein
MNDLLKSQLLFALGCIPARAGLVYLAHTNAHANTLSILPYITLLIGIGFLALYFTKSRMTAPETFEKPVWWNELRLFHGILFVGYSALALQNCDHAWGLLALDLAVGVGGFVQHL